MTSPTSPAGRCPHIPAATGTDAVDRTRTTPPAGSTESVSGANAVSKPEEDVFSSPATSAPKTAGAGESKTEAAKKIPCPALATLFASGILPTSEDGTVKIADLDRTLTELGMNSALRGIFTRGADGVDGANGTVNIFELNGSSLDHTGSSGIRQDGVHPERFEELVRYSSDGKTLTSADFARAANAYAAKDPGLRGTATQTLEFAAILQVFGRRDDNGNAYFTIEDARNLWLDGKLPEGWSAQSRNTGILSVLGRAAQMGLQRIFG